jgi:hypothetical protein
MGEADEALLFLNDFFAEEEERDKLTAYGKLAENK